jgi:hypothetical protein
VFEIYFHKYAVQIKVKSTKKKGIKKATNNPKFAYDSPLNKDTCVSAALALISM